MSNPITQFITEAKKALSQLAEDSMMYPKADPFEHGCQCGKYQGLDFALEILESILRDDQEKELKS